MRFGKWTAIECVGRNKSGGAMWKCKCDCGTVKNVDGRSLRDGTSTCCGCERKNMDFRRNVKHGGKNERLYGVWNGIKDRCLNIKAPAYKDYGGRGITICDEWKDDYAAFRIWAINNGYDQGAPKGQCTLNRIDNNGDYCPGNCEWVNMKSQNNNRRNNHYIEFNGEVHTISEWAEITGLQKSTIRRRIVNYGWPIERALSEANNHAKQ